MGRNTQGKKTSRAKAKCQSVLMMNTTMMMAMLLCLSSSEIWLEARL